MRYRLHAAPALAAALMFCAVVAGSDEPRSGGMTVQLTEAKNVAPVTKTVGEADSSKWTATTYEAAASEANKKVLAGGKPATVTGEVVDVSCYLQLGKRGKAHVACGSKCIANGQPIGLVDDAGNLYVLFAEEHHPRRDGTVDLKTAFGPLLADTVTVAGMMTELRGNRALFVRAEKLASGVSMPAPEPVPMPAPQPVKDLGGK